jgi:pentatricopeptide repeat protein
MLTHADTCVPHADPCAPHAARPACRARAQGPVRAAGARAQPDRPGACVCCVVCDAVRCVRALAVCAVCVCVLRVRAVRCVCVLCMRACVRCACVCCACAACVCDPACVVCMHVRPRIERARAAITAVPSPPPPQAQAAGLHLGAPVYNSLLVCAGRSGQLGRAFEVLDRMTSSGVTPDAKTFGSLIEVGLLLSERSGWSGLGGRAARLNPRP